MICVKRTRNRGRPASKWPTSDSRRGCSALYRYPVKGLTPEPLERVRLTAGETLPFDRAYAIENGPGRFDPASSRGTCRRSTS